MKNKIAITTTSFAKDAPALFKLIEAGGLEAITNNFGRKLEKKEIMQVCSGCIGIIAGTETYDAETLKGLEGLKIISRCGVGIDNIDMQAAADLGIKIFNTPDAPTIAVAELTVALILNLLRKVIQMDKGIRNDKWGKLMGNTLCGKNVGIIGFGRIGQKVGELISGFAAGLAYNDIEVKTPSFHCVKKGLDDILGWADIITLHTAGSNAKKPVIGQREFNLMKKGSWFINVSRGEAVDEDALVDALKRGHLSGAAIDVFRNEPYSGPLKGFDNVILTPHIGSYAKECRIRMERECVENLIKGLT